MTSLLIESDSGWGGSFLLIIGLVMSFEEQT